MMNCPKCGKENPEGASFCHSCGSSLINLKPEGFQQPAENNESFVGKKSVKVSSEFKKFGSELKNAFEEGLNSAALERNDTVCPFCRESNCMPLQKNATEIDNKGYRWGNGCCGMFLLGPFGLLCGLCGIGSKTKITSELWWICKKCGKPHIALQDALKKWEAVVSGLIGSGVSYGIAFAIIKWLELGFISFVGTVVLLLGPAFGLYSVHKNISEELGESLIYYLTAEQKKEAIQDLLIATTIAFVIGLFGMPLLNVMLSE